MYEILQWYATRHPAVRLQWWYVYVVRETLSDWCEVRTRMTMDAVDEHLKAIDVGPSGVPDPVLAVKPSEVDGLDDIALSAPWRRD